MGWTTRLRMGVIDFSITGPTESSQSSSVARRDSNSSQIRSSGQSASESAGQICRYRRLILGERME
jgi:hypothetical protein